MIEDRISEFADSSISEQKRENRLNKKMSSLTDLWDNKKRYISLGFQKEKRVGMKGYLNKK